jgi:hypothetical protein
VCQFLSYKYGLANIRTSGPRPTSGRSSRAPVLASHPTRSILFPTSASIRKPWSRPSRAPHDRTVPPCPSSVRNVEPHPTPRPHDRTRTRAHLPHLQMCTAKASVGPTREPGGTPAIAGRRRHATLDLLLKHLDETFAT